jgi:tetrahydromethanopterin S-methyltransferase subunit E
MPDIDDKIRFVIPVMLDDVSVRLGPWSGYHVLAQHLILTLSLLFLQIFANGTTLVVELKGYVEYHSKLWRVKKS